MCSYRDDFAKFEATGAVLLGISPQDVDSHEEWAEKKGFHFPLLADTDKKVIEAYGVGRQLIAVKRRCSWSARRHRAFVDRKVIGATSFGRQARPVLAAVRGHRRGARVHPRTITGDGDPRRRLPRCRRSLRRRRRRSSSARETAMKVKHSRDPHVASACSTTVLRQWVQVEGTPRSCTPEAMDGLVEYYRRLGRAPRLGRLPRRMERERGAVRITVTRRSERRARFRREVG